MHLIDLNVKKKKQLLFSSSTCFKCLLLYDCSLYTFGFKGVIYLKMLLNWKDTTSNEAMVQNTREWDWGGKASGSTNEMVPNIPTPWASTLRPEDTEGWDKCHHEPYVESRTSTCLCTFWRMECSSLDIHNEESRQKQLPWDRRYSVSIFRRDESAKRSLTTLQWLGEDFSEKLTWS